MTTKQIGITGFLSTALIIYSLTIPAHAEVPVVQQQNRIVGSHQNTRWVVTSSFKFDVLCFISVLTGDPFYLRHYQQEFDQFAPQLTPAARSAVVSLKRRIKDENKNVLPAFLCLYFSTTNDQTLDAMLESLRDDGRLKEELKKTIYFSEGGWRLFASVKRDLSALFLFLKNVQFEDYWRRTALPAINARIASLETDLRQYNVVREVERGLGLALSSDTITVHLLAYAWPHGMRVAGSNFIVDVSYPLRTIVQNAVHEMMHPPYDLHADGDLRRAINKLKADQFLMDRVLRHNPSFGYNSFESFIEENCVRALDQFVSEKLTIAREPRKRWKDEDDGMHVFAAILYHEMQLQKFNQTNGTFRDFLLQLLMSGKIKPGEIERLYDAVYR